MDLFFFAWKEAREENIKVKETSIFFMFGCCFFILSQMHLLPLITFALVICLVDGTYGESQSMISNKEQINRVVAGGTNSLTQNDI